MAVRRKIELHGAKELDAVLRQLPDRVERQVLGAGIRSGATLVRREIMRDAPRGSEPPHPKYGRLVTNIAVSKRQVRPGAVGYTVHSGRAFWARFLEFGTRFMAARPFFRPAFDRAAEPAIKRIAAQIAKGVAREAGKLAGPYLAAARKLGVRR